METKQYYSTHGSEYRGTLTEAIIFGVLAVISVILLISPILMYRLWDTILDGLDDPYIFFLILGLFSSFEAIFFIRGLKHMSKPYVELFDDQIAITNMNNGVVSTINYKDIDKLELSEVKVLWKKLKCVKIYPVKGRYEQIIGRRGTTERKRTENMYKHYGGVIDMIFSNFLALPIETVFEDFQNTLENYKTTLNKSNN